MNNKGQTLVIFVILLPFMCVLFGYILDKCYLLYQEKKLKEVAAIVCKYSLNQEKTEMDIKQLALENDEKIENIKINRNASKAKIVLEKKEVSIFSSLVGIDSYQIRVSVDCIE